MDATAKVFNLISDMTYMASGTISKTSFVTSDHHIAGCYFFCRSLYTPRPNHKQQVVLGSVCILFPSVQVEVALHGETTFLVEFLSC